MKVCAICKLSKENTEFHKNISRKGGLDSWCKACSSIKRTGYYRENPEHYRKAVSVCRKKHLPRLREYNRKYNKSNPDKVTMWNKNKPLVKKLLAAARRRSVVRGLPCTIDESHIVIPEFCPVLGIKLEQSKTAHSCPTSPSLDCVIPSLGYVPGNIAVISHKANTIKSNASLSDLEKVTAWVREKTWEATRATLQDALLHGSAVLKIGTSC